MTDINQVEFIAFYSDSIVNISSGEVENLIYQLRQMGYRITDGFAQPFDSPDNLITESSQVDSEILAMTRPGTLGGSLNFWNFPFEFRFSLLFEPGEDTEWIISVENDTLMGTSNQLGEENSLRFIEVVKAVLKVFPPLYGCAVGFQDPPSVDDVFEQNISGIYRVNFFGTSLVDSFSQISSAPAWLVEEIANGIFLVPSLQAVYTDDPVSIRNVEEYLGWGTAFE